MDEKPPQLTHANEEPYKSTPEDRRRALMLGIVYVLLAIFLAYMLFKIWPPTPWPSDSHLARNPQLAKALADCECPTPTPTPTPTPQAGQATAIPTGTPPRPGATATPTVTPGGSPTATPRTNPTATPPGTQSSTAPPSATPPNQSAAAPTPTPDDLLVNIPITFLGYCRRTSFDERLILLVIIAGILGSFVHGATSLADFIGNDKFNKSWTWFYLLRPAIGMALALVFYFVVRGGFLTTSGGAKDINPYGIAALAGLVGMFSKQATDKLSEVFTTLFRAAAGEGDDKRSGSLTAGAGAITITNLDPKQVKAGSQNQVLKVTGTKFANGAQVFLDDKPLVTTFDSATQLTAKLPDQSIATAGTFKLKVVNPDKTESAPVSFVVTA